MRLIMTEFGLRVHRVDLISARRLDRDFHVEAMDAYGELTTRKVEVKTDTKGLWTNNLAIELWLDNRHPERRDGWFYTYDADIFVFVQTRARQPRRTIAVKAAALRGCVYDEMDNPSKFLASVYDKENKRFGTILCLPIRKVMELEHRDRMGFLDDGNGKLEVLR